MINKDENRQCAYKVISWHVRLTILQWKHNNALRLFPLLIYIQPSDIQGVPGANVNILGGHIIGHSKQKSVYVRVSYSERFPI